MHCDSCHDISWLRERPSLVRLQGQLASPIRIFFLEVALLWIQLFTGFMLTDHDNWHIDDREHCLQGRSIVRVNISANVTAPIDRLSTLKVVLDWPWWLTYRRPRTLPARPVYSHDIRANVNIFNIFNTAWVGARPGLGRLESLRPAKVCMNRSTHVRY